MQLSLLLIWLALCAAQDARQRHIANGLTLGAAVLALAYLLWTGTTWLGAEAVQGGWAFLLALAFTLPGYALRRLGAGDVKLAIGTGALTGTFGFDVWMLAALGAPLLTAGWAVVATLRRSKKTLPHGPSMCLAAVTATALAVV